MIGTMYLINKRNVSIFSFLFVLNCCATIPPEVGGKWRAAFDGVINYYQGYPDYPITAQMIDEIPYASLRMKIGDGPAGLVILQEINNDADLHLGKRRQCGLFLSQWRIIETHGLLNNLTNITMSISDESYKVDFQEQKNYVRILSLSNPEVNSLKIVVNKKVIGKEVINILGKDHETYLVEEYLTNEYINWEYKNYFWVDTSTGFVWKSIQQIAPNVPPIKIEILKKPA